MFACILQIACKMIAFSLGILKAIQSKFTTLKHKLISMIRSIMIDLCKIHIYFLFSWISQKYDLPTNYWMYSEPVFWISCWSDPNHTVFGLSFRFSHFRIDFCWIVFMFYIYNISLISTVFNHCFTILLFRPHLCFCCPPVPSTSRTIQTMANERFERSA